MTRRDECRHQALRELESANLEFAREEGVGALKPSSLLASQTQRIVDDVKFLVSEFTDPSETPSSYDQMMLEHSREKHTNERIQNESILTIDQTSLYLLSTGPTTSFPCYILRLSTSTTSWMRSVLHTSTQTNCSKFSSTSPISSRRTVSDQKSKRQSARSSPSCVSLPPRTLFSEYDAPCI
jgi:hypothetical protein